MTKPFNYRDLGLGGVHLARLRGDVLRTAARRGRLGWLAWLVIHITFLTGYRNRLGALLTWAHHLQQGDATGAGRSASLRAGRARVFGPDSTTD